MAKAEAQAKAQAQAKAKVPAQTNTGALTPDEMAEYQELEKQARQGRNQPFPQDMMKLAEYRKRVKENSKKPE